MRGTTFQKIAKISIYVFLLYILWFRYAYSVKNIILYSTTLLAATCMFCDLLMSHQNMREVFPIGVLINVVMCIYSLVFGLFVAINQDLLFNAVITYSAFSIVCLAICYISKEEKSFDWLLNAIIAIDVLCSIFVLTRGYYWIGYGYVLGPSHNPNTFGMVMNLGLFCLTYRTQKNRKRMVLYAGLIVLFLFVIINCGSRKNLFAAIIICLLWLFQQSRIIWRNGRWMTRIVLLVSIALIISFAAYYYANVFSKTDVALRMEKLGDQSEGSSRNRMLYYKFAIEYFLERPVFGIGLQQFIVWNPLGQYSHSTYAEAVADWGLVGCLIFFIPVIWAAIKLMKYLLSSMNNETTRSIIALWIMEIFLGVGQIWFYEIEHLIAWTIIYLYVDMSDYIWHERNHISERKYKYVKA